MFTDTCFFFLFLLDLWWPTVSPRLKLIFFSVVKSESGFLSECVFTQRSVLPFGVASLSSCSFRPCWLTFMWWGCFYGLCKRHKPTELAHSFLFCSFVYFCLCGPFNCISFHNFSRQLSAFSFCSSGLISALLVLSTMHHFMKVCFSPDIIPGGWLGSKHQLTN